MDPKDGTPIPTPPEQDPSNSAVKPSQRSWSAWACWLVAIVGIIAALDPGQVCGGDAVCTTIIKLAGLLVAVLAALGVKIAQTRKEIAGIVGAENVAVAVANNPVPKAPARLGV